MPDAFTQLEEDHRKVEGLFDRFAQSGDTDTALTICRELTIHAMLEEELVYPTLASNITTSLADEARREHNEAKTLISQIESGIGRGEDVSALVEQLRQGVQHHVQEEETEIFPRLRETLPEMVSEMGEEIAQRKETLQAKAEGMSPSQAPSSVANKAASA
jgi:hemerythrin superfamily protein